jgi:phosphoserine phosphatase RsbU/P
MKLLLKTLKLPVTTNWILGGFMVSMFFSIIKIIDSQAMVRIEFWQLGLIFVYDFCAAIYLNTKLTKGTWNIPKWAKLSFLFWFAPMMFANAFLASSLDNFLIVPIATLYGAFLGVLGIYEKKYYLWGASLYVFFYLYLNVLIRGFEDQTWWTGALIYSIFSWVSLYWLSLTSHFISSQNQTIQKLLRGSRKDKRELATERKTIKDLIERLNRSFTIIKKDLNTAKKIQESILPGKNKVYPLPVKIFSSYLPMNEVGGDFYDICQPEPHKLRVFLADATGHGVQGALITMLIKVEYEFLKTTISDPGELMEQLNRDYFLRYRPLNMYYTCILADINTEKKEIEFVSAGHPTQVLLHEKSIHLLNRTGRMVGLSRDAQYEINKFSYTKGDRLYLFTDGLIEQFNENREEFGESRLHDLILSQKDLEVNLQCEKIIQTVQHHIIKTELQDDITMVACEFD